LGADFIGSATGAEVKPVAVITGLGGMGKTALVAEALGLWESRFEWVLLYQAKPNVLGLNRDFLWNMHVRLISGLCWPSVRDPLFIGLTSSGLGDEGTRGDARF